MRIEQAIKELQEAKKNGTKNIIAVWWEALAFDRNDVVYLLVGLFVGGFPILPLTLLSSGEPRTIQVATFLLLWNVAWAIVCFLSAFISHKTSEVAVTDNRLIVKAGFIHRQTH